MPTETITRQQVVDLVMTLPSDRLVSVYDFALFVQSRPLELALALDPDDDWLNDTEEQLQAEDALWEATYARHRDQFAALAEAAQAEIAAGVTQPMCDEHGKFAV